MKYPQINIRVDDEFLRKLDDWRRTEVDLPGRPEAIRRIVDEKILKTGEPVSMADQSPTKPISVAGTNDALMAIINDMLQQMRDEYNEQEPDDAKLTNDGLAKLLAIDPDYWKTRLEHMLENEFIRAFKELRRAENRKNKKTQ